MIKLHVKGHDYYTCTTYKDLKTTIPILNYDDRNLSATCTHVYLKGYNSCSVYIVQ